MGDDTWCEFNNRFNLYAILDRLGDAEGGKGRCNTGKQISFDNKLLGIRYKGYLSQRETFASSLPGRIRLPKPKAVVCESASGFGPRNRSGLKEIGPL